jgi:hypothetical protein
MGFPFKVSLIFVMALMAGIILHGCISYELVRQVRGAEIMPPDNRLKPGRTTLSEVLSLYGAPDKIGALGDHNLLIYERTIYSNSGIALGIPLVDFPLINPEISAGGRLGRHDTLALFFTSDHILREMIYTKGSSYPYMKTLFEEQSASSLVSETNEASSQTGTYRAD